MLTAEQYTLFITTAAITLAVTTFYGIRKYQGNARKWYVATMIFGGVLGVLVSANTDISLSLAFTIGLGAQQLVKPVRELIDKWVARK
jgi:hypothetical protein